MTSPDTARACPICAVDFPATNVQRQYCSTRCRKIAWKRRHRADQAGPPSPNSDAVPAVPAVASIPATGAGTPRCPHCAKPVAVINLLVSPAAAHVAAPEASHA